LKSVTIVARHQKHVDVLFERLKAESSEPAKRPLFKPAPPRLAASRDEMDHRVAEELGTIQRRLEQLGDVLAKEPLLLNRYGTHLQSIDLVMQQLGHLAKVVSSEDKAAAAEQVTLQDLRQRLGRRPIRSILS
jgi:hypothetical protein